MRDLVLPALESSSRRWRRGQNRTENRPISPRSVVCEETFQMSFGDVTHVRYLFAVALFGLRLF